MAKSGVEYLAKHPGWKTKGKKRAQKPKQERLYRYADANTHTDHLTLAEAQKFQRAQNGGSIVPMSDVGNSSIHLNPLEREARAGVIFESDWDILETELAALHDLQSTCQVVLRDVPHQKGCQFFDASKPWRYRESCTCIRKTVADLEHTLANQLG